VSRLRALGLMLRGAAVHPEGVHVPFAWVRVHHEHAFISGHGSLNYLRPRPNVDSSPASSPAGPSGRVPTEVSLTTLDAPLATLAMLATVKSTVGDFDRASAWLTVAGNVNPDPGYPHTTLSSTQSLSCAPAQAALLPIF